MINEVRKKIFRKARNGHVLLTILFRFSKTVFYNLRTDKYRQQSLQNSFQ